MPSNLYSRSLVGKVSFLSPIIFDLKSAERLDWLNHIKPALVEMLGVASEKCIVDVQKLDSLRENNVNSSGSCFSCLKYLYFIQIIDTKFKDNINIQTLSTRWYS